jgi:hypothetical protein
MRGLIGVSSPGFGSRASCASNHRLAINALLISTAAGTPHSWSNTSHIMNSPSKIPTDAYLTKSGTVKAILEHLGLPCTGPPIAPRALTRDRRVLAKTTYPRSSSSCAEVGCHGPASRCTLNSPRGAGPQLGLAGRFRKARGQPGLHIPTYPT